MMGIADGYMLGHAPVGHTIRRAGLFEAANVPFMTQNNGGNITLAMVVHMAAAFERATLHHVTLSRMWAEDVVRPTFEVVGGQVQVPEAPGLGLTLDREALERLKAMEVEPLPRALIRISHGRGYTTYARPPVASLPRDCASMLAGVGEGYDLPVDQDSFFDDGSERFAALWERTGEGLVTEVE